MSRPLIGLTTDVVDGEARMTRQYFEMVAAAGGLPVLLPPQASLRCAMLDRVDGVILTGGADIDVSRFGVPLHAQADCMPPERQDAEFALLDALAARPEIPVLGICLGMQLMGVHRGNRMIQHLDDVLVDAARHRRGAEHPVEAERDSPLVSGPVRSYHHQALAEAKTFQIAARSDDGVIEAIFDPTRRFYLGVQWHPERTPSQETGLNVVRGLIEASRQVRRCAADPI